MVTMNHHDQTLKGDDRTSRLKIVVSILVAIVVVLSGLTVFYYLQAKDYHDAKYRAQYVIISDIRQHISDAGSYISLMTYPEQPLVSREVDGCGAVLQLEDLSSLVWAIQEMYLNDPEKNDTFSSLRHAVDVLRSNSWTVFVHMELNRTQDTPWEENLTLNAEINTAGSLLVSLLPIIDEGFDYGVDFEEHPYSIVGRLDLQAIKSTAISIIDSFSPSLMAA